ncbi:MAG TPA: tetratricopeptide repeat protein [Opitutaceae bacterium]|jgi:tetratricopeptide (TPR) repeat protein|nr:tetratricopeptide repeat protein [Opitutaceae bacterium]
MKLRRWLCLVLLALPLCASAKLDPKRIINESNAFLKDREPEMTDEENALYDRVVAMLAIQPQFAIKLLEGMVAENQRPSPAFSFILGNAYYASGDYAQAEARYRDAVTRFPSFLRAWNNLGVLYYSEQKFDAAIPCFSQSIALGDRDPTTFGLLGYSLEKSGNDIAAEVAYLQAVAAAPDDRDWTEGLLRIYLASGLYTRAEVLLKAMIKAYPSDGEFWLEEADVLINTDRKLEAMGLLEQAQALGIAGEDATEDLADLYAQEHLVPEAIAAYRKLMVQQRGLGEQKLLEFAQILIADHQWADAASVLDGLAAGISAERKVAYLQTRADWLMGQQKWPEALAQARAILRLAPMNGTALVTEGKAYAAQGDRARAQIAFEAAYQVPDTAYQASIELANIELKNRHYDKTVGYLEKALTLQRSAALESYLAQIRTLLPPAKG